MEYLKLWKKRQNSKMHYLSDKYNNYVEYNGDLGQTYNKTQTSKIYIHREEVVPYVVRTFSVQLLIGISTSK